MNDDWVEGRGRNPISQGLKSHAALNSTRSRGVRNLQEYAAIRARSFRPEDASHLMASQTVRCFESKSTRKQYFIFQFQVSFQV